MIKALAIIAAGLFAIYMGFKSFAGYEAETEHLFGGEFVTLTCDGGGHPVTGIGWQSNSAERACHDEVSDQRGRAKWWVFIGAAVVFIGHRSLKKARAG
jgi:hypothetical protein